MGWIEELEQTFGSVAKTLHILQKSDDLLTEIMPDSDSPEETEKESSSVDSDETDE
jgi:hypothetical protein